MIFLVEPIRGKVIRITGPNSLIINAGEEHGVSKGMRFVVFEEGDEILDPETRESLGKIEFIKAEVEVKSTHPKFSVVVSPKRTVSTLDLSGLVNLAYAIGKYTTVEQEPLPVDPEDISPVPEPKEKKIKIGDPVRQIVVGLQT